MLAKFALWVPKHCKSLSRRWLGTRGGLWRNGWSLSLPWSCLHLYFQVQATSAPFPETSVHIGDDSESPSLPTDKSRVDVFADFFSANGEDLWSSVDEKIRFVLTHRDGRQGYQHARCGPSTSRRARLGNPGGKFFHCIRVGGLFPIRKAFQIRRTWLREGSRCVNVLLLPKSLYLICPPYVGRHPGGELFS